MTKETGTLLWQPELMNWIKIRDTWNFHYTLETMIAGQGFTASQKHWSSNLGAGSVNYKLASHPSWKSGDNHNNEWKVWITILTPRQESRDSHLSFYCLSINSFLRTSHKLLFCKAETNVLIWYSNLGKQYLRGNCLKKGLIYPQCGPKKMEQRRIFMWAMVMLDSHLLRTADIV